MRHAPPQGSACAREIRQESGQAGELQEADPNRGYLTWQAHRSDRRAESTRRKFPVNAAADERGPPEQLCPCARFPIRPDRTKDLICLLLRRCTDLQYALRQAGEGWNLTYDAAGFARSS